MADQGALDRYNNEIYHNFVWQGEDGNGGINGHSIANLAWHGPADLRQEVLNSIWATPINDNENRGAYNAGVVIGTMSWRVLAILEAANKPKTRLVMGKDDPTGAVYAVTDTTFRHVADGNVLEAGKALGLWGDWKDIITLPAEQVAMLAKHLGGELYVAPEPEPEPDPEPEIVVDPVPAPEVQK